MESSNILFIAALAQGLILAVLLVIWFYAGRANYRLFERPVSKAKSLLEQRLILEAL